MSTSMRHAFAKAESEFEGSSVTVRGGVELGGSVPTSLPGSPRAPAVPPGTPREREEEEEIQEGEIAA